MCSSFELFPAPETPDFVSIITSLLIRVHMGAKARAIDVA